MTVPDFDLHGVLPPILPGLPGNTPARSPYATTMSGLCRRFGRSPERCAILRGLLRLRAALRDAGLRDGFQWIDGSFAEDVERVRGRAPADVDVVSYLFLGGIDNQRDLIANHPHLFDAQSCKRDFRVDHYLQNLSAAQDRRTLRGITYWYSMWSHRRGDDRWKGFLEVPMTSDDDVATLVLDELEAEDATQQRGTP